MTEKWLCKKRCVMTPSRDIAFHTGKIYEFKKTGENEWIGKSETANSHIMRLVHMNEYFTQVYVLPEDLFEI